MTTKTDEENIAAIQHHVREYQEREATVTQPKTFRDLKPGDKVFVVEQLSRRSSGQKKTTETIVKIGRKFAYLESGYRERKFCLDTGHSVHGDNDHVRYNGFGFDVYLSESEYDVKQRQSDEKARLFERMVNRWGWFIELPPNVVREIHTLLDSIEGGESHGS